MQVGRVDLLSKLYRDVVIPSFVRGELLRFHQDVPDFLRVLDAPAGPLLDELLKLLDPGEAHAICLAKEKSADAVLMDETRGRAIATRRGLIVVGLLGVLTQAKQAGLIDRIAPILDELEHETTFWISAALRARVLAGAGES